MRTLIMTVAAGSMLAGCATYSDGRGGAYYADRYYRDGPSYSERVLTDSATIYVGQDGRYYCKRNDGTTGLIVGGIAGGALGAVIAPGGSKTLGALLGAGAGALAGRAIERDQVKCR